MHGYKQVLVYSDDFTLWLVILHFDITLVISHFDRMKLLQV